MRSIQPRNDYVLIRRHEEMQLGRIVIPDIAKEKSLRGTVLAVGPGKMIEGINGGSVRRTPEVKVGDEVYFNSKWNDFAGDHYTTSTYQEHLSGAEGQRLHLVQEGDIFLIDSI